MKRSYLYIASFLLIAVFGCKKEDKIDYQFDNSQSIVPNELDNWLTKTLLEPYNIEVIYRYDRYKGNIERNLAPVEESRVQPQMEVVLNAFLKPYETVAGKEFIKTYTPKEWVLYGSTSYNNDGSEVLGTAAGGRNITLYQVNYLDITNAEQVRRRLRTIHHEFTHTLQQTKAMPKDFEGISEGDYFDDWTNNTLNPITLSDSLGFVSRYARSQYFEDFAETSAHLLLQGQLWYDNQAKKYNALTYQRLKKKEASVVAYFRDSHNIDFRKLQREMANIMYTQYNDKAFQALGLWWLTEGLFTNPILLKENLSADVKTIYEALEKGVSDKYTAKYTLPSGLQFMMTAKNNNIVIRMPFRGSAGQNTTTIYNADYNFSYAYDVEKQTISFTKTAQGTTTTYANADLFMNEFMNSIGKYLTSGTFKLDWSLSSPSKTRLDEGFFESGGFHKLDNRNSYINFNFNRVVK